MTKQKFNAKKLAKAILDKRIKDDLSFKAITKNTKGALHYATLQRVEGEVAMPSAAILGDICNWLELPVSTFYN